MAPSALFLDFTPRADLNGTTQLNNDGVQAVPVMSEAYIAATTTSLTACITLMVALMYVAGLSIVHKYAQAHPKALNKLSGFWLQRYAPFGYVFLVMTSLCELATTSWILLQYRLRDSSPSPALLTALRFLIFPATWTAFTAGAYSVLFVHPRWSRHPTVSVGSQSLWVLATWVLWVVGAGLLNAAVDVAHACSATPTAENGSAAAQSADGNTITVADARSMDGEWCGQVRGAFGVAILQTLTLTAAMLTVLWLAWQSARETWSVHDRPVTMISRASQMLYQPELPPPATPNLKASSKAKAAT